ncbi:potassium channel, subfamily K, member 16-like [Ptychodera flava]|uniref:potassium channel, subfamily K, member 16-like n=1 Tax=Ptychodera flava TaxID=63121 RepID=UPI00396A1CD9
MHWVSMLILCIVFLVYLVIGAAIFMALEAGNEESARETIRHFKETWLSNNTCVDGDAMEDLISAAVSAINSGVSPRYNSSDPTDWDYSSSLFFAGTVVTTIGYGESVPKTFWGRNFVIVYALIGIPLTGCLLSDIGDRWQAKFRKRCKAISRLLPRKTPRWLRRLLQLFTVGLLSWFVFVVVPAFVFMHIENWEFYIAHYYTFVTLTTIGFGDFVASRDSQLPGNVQWVYDILVAVWYLFGLSYLAVVVTAITKEQQDDWKKVKKLSNVFSKKQKSGKAELYQLEGVQHQNQPKFQGHVMTRSLSLGSGLSTLGNCCLCVENAETNHFDALPSITCERHAVRKLNDGSLLDNGLACSRSAYRHKPQ